MSDEDDQKFSFTDKRKVDPADGSVRPDGSASSAEPAGAGEDGTADSADTAGTADSAAPEQGEAVDPLDAEAAQLFEQAQQDEDGAGDGTAQLEARVAELEEQLKREQAEYVNSRRRIEQAAEARATAAAEKVLASLIGVLDDVTLGRQHGDIAEGTPFHSIATKLEEALAGHGLVSFGEVGEEFDPTLHEALMHEDSPEAESTTIKLVMQPGYKVGDRVLRPARVATQGPA